MPERLTRLQPNHTHTHTHTNPFTLRFAGNEERDRPLRRWKEEIVETFKIPLYLYEENCRALYRRLFVPSTLIGT